MLAQAYGNGPWVRFGFDNGKSGHPPRAVCVRLVDLHCTFYKVVSMVRNNNIENGSTPAASQDKSKHLCM